VASAASPAMRSGAAWEQDRPVLPSSRGGANPPRSVAAGPPLPPVLALASRIVCHSRNRVRAATGERLYVVPCASSEQPRAMRPGATAGREPGGRAGMLSLEFPRHLARSVFPRRGRRAVRSRSRPPRCMRTASGQRGSARACRGHRSRPPVKVIGSAVESYRRYGISSRAPAK
jgi:hypothetical protein